MSSRNMLGAATRYIAGRNAVQTVYWRADSSSDQVKMVKVSKTLNFGKNKESLSPPQHVQQERRIIYN